MKLSTVKTEYEQLYKNADFYLKVLVKEYLEAVKQEQPAMIKLHRREMLKQRNRVEQLEHFLFQLNKINEL